MELDRGAAAVQTHKLPQPPAPKLPAEIIAKSQAKYLEAYRWLTGRDL